MRRSACLIACYLWLCGSIFIFLLFCSVSVRAADIGCDVAFEGNPIPYQEERWPLGSRPSVGTCYQAFIIGEIKKGDYEKVRSIYSKNNPFLATFVIASSGGDVVEAIKIGTLFRKYLVQIIGPSGDPKIGFMNLFLSDQKNRCNQFHLDCGCASACALIWFGAVHRSGVVGLHRPRIEDQLFKSLPTAEASKIYKDILASIVRYLDEMEAPKRLINAMVSTGSSEIQWIEADFELERPPSIAEWVDATCSPLSSNERKTKRLLENKSTALERIKAKLPENELHLLKEIWSKESDHDMCETILLDVNREKLPKP
jgi:hypothetical protein